MQHIVISMYHYTFHLKAFPFGCCKKLKFLWQDTNILSTGSIEFHCLKPFWLQGVKHKWLFYHPCRQSQQCKFSCTVWMIKRTFSSRTSAWIHWWYLDFEHLQHENKRMQQKIENQSSSPAVFVNRSRLMKWMRCWQWKLVSTGCFSSTPLISESQEVFVQPCVQTESLWYSDKAPSWLWQVSTF